MAISVFKSKLKRMWTQWTDPEFDGDRYDDLRRIDVGDNEYYESKRAVFCERVYCLFVNEYDCNDLLIRELIFEDGKEYFLPVDEENCSAVWHLFYERAYGGRSLAYDEETEEIQSFYEMLKKRTETDLMNEGDEQGEQ